ncbi:MAG TPA: AAA family ATPase [Chitinophagaceae bacterium]|nr:AAA family ATPase [Chitinophagaceae bacterium]
MKENLIFRKQYLDKIRPFIGNDLIKIITGQRRIGKSYMLKQLIEEIKKDHPEAHIIYIDKELEEFSGIRNSADLHNYVKANIAKEKDNFLFIDEVQEIESFQRCLRSLINQQECDIYCTGSNATMLSVELATLLAGRYMEFPIHGLSYLEFLEFNRIVDSKENLNLFLTLGGMPYQYQES